MLNTEGQGKKRYIINSNNEQNHIDGLTVDSKLKYGNTLLFNVFASLKSKLGDISLDDNLYFHVTHPKH